MAMVAVVMLMMVVCWVLARLHGRGGDDDDGDCDVGDDGDDDGCADMMIAFTMVIGMVIAMGHTMQVVYICVSESRRLCKDSLARGARAACFIYQSRARDR
jgi:hypothetical protein